MKGIMARLQAIEDKVSRLLAILDGVDDEPTQAPQHAGDKPANRCRAWHDSDDRVLKRMFKEGCTDDEIGAALHRTGKGIMNRRRKLGMKRKEWKKK